MIHTIEIEIEVPEGWKPKGFGYLESGDNYLDSFGKRCQWVSDKSAGLYIKIQKEKWEPKNGDVVLTFDAATGVYNLTFRAGAQEHVSLKEKGFLFETLKEAQHAYNETLKLMEKLKEEK